MKSKRNMEDSIWVLYAIILGTGMLSDTFELKPTLLAFALVGVLHLYVVLRKK
ncbi:MAG: hypothetical protein V3S42_03185 [Candidatus Neomarinimicrobiota bacterium]